MGSNYELPAYEIVKHIKIDIEENEPHQVHRNTTDKCNIYKVPCSLRDLDKKDACYTPQLVSIGPIHYAPLDNELKLKLKPMQTQKLRYLDLFCDRVAKSNAEAMGKFKEYIKGNIGDIRQRYADKLCDNINEDEKLVEMMLLDSVFIMELFLRVQRRKSDENAHSEDIIVKQSWLNKCIQRDLLLLENQIPLMILEELYENVVPEDDKKRDTFIELAHDYFDCFHTYKIEDGESSSSSSSSSSSEKETTAKGSDFNAQPSENNGNSSGPGLKKEPSSSFRQLEKNWDNNKPQHFTDLIRSFYLCKGMTHEKKETSLKTATKLRESGVSFKKVRNRPLLDIQFEKVPVLRWFLCLGCFPLSKFFKARLEIPQLKVDDTTECVLRNLIAFEQCHYPHEPYICNYVSFIDSLIHTKDDVELLVEKEVIVHELGSDKEVATLVNGLCKHVVADKTCYRNIIGRLNKHEKKQWYRSMAALRLVYFRDAWRASSTLVATAVLVFTIFNFCRVVRLVLDLEAGSSKQP